MKHSNLNKLNHRGIAHQILPLIFIVLFSVIGVGYMVASHADPIGTKSKTKPKIVINDAQIYADGYDVQGKIINKDKSNVYADACTGKVKIEVVYKGKVKHSQQTTPFIEQGSTVSQKICIFDASTQNQKFVQGGKYTIKVKFLGNPWLKSSSHSPIKRSVQKAEPIQEGGQTFGES